MLDTVEKPSFDERYDAATSASVLDGDELTRGAVHVLVASGLAAASAPPPRFIDTPNGRLGHAIMRMESEWRGAQLPPEHRAKSIRQYIDELPLIRVGEREVKGVKTPTMGRDKAGAIKAHHDEKEAIAQRYSQELVLLATRLGARHKVMNDLYLVAVSWGIEDADRYVAGVLLYWLHVRGKAAGPALTLPLHGGDLYDFMQNCVSAQKGRIEEIRRKMLRAT